jgi:A/G-specific adenine glycosylase
MAEMMLQRTRASQAEAVWTRFISAYPSAVVAAASPDEELHAAMASLGLQWRAKNIIATIHLMSEAGRVDPDNLSLLPGVGAYAAAATRCFAFGRRTAVVDANVVRVYARLFALPLNDSLRRSPRFLAFAEDLLPKRAARQYNWGLLDLGATVCVRVPRCSECPLQKRCRTYEH